MDLRELSLKERALVEALIEVAQSECSERGWTEIEPMLVHCWNRNRAKASALTWTEVAPLIRAVCERTH